MNETTIVASARRPGDVRGTASWVASFRSVVGAASRYFYGASIRLEQWPADPCVWVVHNARGVVPNMIVRRQGSWFRMERLPDGFTVADAAETPALF